MTDESKQWQCSSTRVVYDDVHCSQVTELRPDDEVAFWGYRSDGRTHVWEQSASKISYELEGPADTSPNTDCGNWTPPSEQETTDETDPVIDPNGLTTDTVILIAGALLLCCILSLLCCICCCCCKKRREKEEQKQSIEAEMARAKQRREQEQQHSANAMN